MKKILIFFIIITAIIVIISLFTAVTGKIPLGDKVAVVRVEGVIMDSKSVIEELKDYASDISVKAIVLRVDSPGGGVAPSQEIYDEVVKAKAKKKIVVSMGSVAASGGYYISCPADKIVANAGTLTGSMGVIMEIPNIEGLMQKIGIQNQIVKSGEHKDIASIFKTMSPDERKLLQVVLDDVHEQFIEAVSKGRGLSIDAVKLLADGRIFTGRMAKGVGLVDELGNLDMAIKLAAELSGIEGEPEVVEKEEDTGFFGFLRSSFTNNFLVNSMPGIKLKYLLSP
ncbi:MAG: signal peptide peptidase SppA [Nitrospirae bacterium]|nr:signal peptide peptidase SppA [Nitrospirota bacterium]